MENIFEKGASWLESWKEGQDKLFKQFGEWEQLFKEKDKTQEQTEAAESFLKDWIQTQTDWSKQWLEAGKSFQDNLMASQKSINDDVQQWVQWQFYQKMAQQWFDTFSEFPDWSDSSNFLNFDGFPGNWKKQQAFFEDMFKGDQPFSFWTNENIAQEFQKFMGVLQSHSSPFSAPLTSLVNEFMEMLTKFSENSTDWGEEKLDELLDQYQEQFAKYLSAQKLGIDRERNEKISQMLIAFIAHCRATGAILREVSKSTVQANLKISQKLSNLAADGEPVTSMKEFARIWSTENEAVFKEMLGDPSYAKIQAEQFKTYCQYKKLGNDLLEEALRETPFATDSDLDLAFKEIHQLKTELRQSRENTNRLTGEINELKNELQALRNSFQNGKATDQDTALEARSTRKTTGTSRKGKA